MMKTLCFITISIAGLSILYLNCQQLFGQVGAIWSLRMVWFLYLVNWKPTLECRRIWWCAFGVIRAAAVMESVVIVVASQLRHAKDDVSGSRLCSFGAPSSAPPNVSIASNPYIVDELYRQEFLPGGGMSCWARRPFVTQPLKNTVSYLSEWWLEFW